MMKGIVGHPNVIRVYGASTTGHGKLDSTVEGRSHPLFMLSVCYTGPLMVICEYAPNGTLQQFLRKSCISDRQDCPFNGSNLKASSILSPSELLTFALQIAKGMQHLALMRVRNIASGIIENHSQGPY